MSFAMNPDGPHANPPTPESKSDLPKKLGLGALAIGVALTLLAVSTAGAPNSAKSVSSYDSSFTASSDSSGDTLVSPDTSSSDWAPAGYTVWSNDSNVAWKWNTTSSCTDQYSCWRADFISQTGCSYFYAAVNILDSNSAVVDYTNASLPSLQPMQTATLQFNDINNAGSTGQMAVINCG